MRDHEEFPWVSHKGLLCSGFVLQKAQQLFYPANPHLDLAASSGHCARTTVTCLCRAPRAALLMVRVTWVGRPCLGLDSGSLASGSLSRLPTPAAHRARTVARAGGKKPRAQLARGQAPGSAEGGQQSKAP